MIGALLAKDIKRELRGKETVLAGAVLVLTFALAFLFAFNSLRTEPRAAALVIWLPLLYAGIAASGRAIANEADQGTLALLRSAPVNIGLHGISRTIANLIVLAIVAAICLGLAAAVWSIPITLMVVLPVALGTVGIAITATMTGALAAQASQRELLLPVLAVPALAPLLQSTLQGTLAALAGAPDSAMQAPLLLALGYDVIAGGIAWILWPILMEGD